MNRTHPGPDRPNGQRRLTLDGMSLRSRLLPSLGTPRSAHRSRTRKD